MADVSARGVAPREEGQPLPRADLRDAPARAPGNGRYCVLIPVFNGGQAIAGLVGEIRSLGLPVIVVDDGSNDRTAALAAARGALVISHLRNLGKGCALRTGFEHVLQRRFDGVVTMDGDGQHNPKEIRALIHAGETQHAGLVLGNRLTNGAVMPFARRQTNLAMSAVISLLARQRIPDSQCGFRFIRREVLQDVSLRARRYEIETELLLAAADRKWKIISVPVMSTYRDQRSHIKPLRETFRFLAILLQHLCSRLSPRRSRSPSQAP